MLMPQVHKLRLDSGFWGEYFPHKIIFKLLQLTVVSLNAKFSSTEFERYSSLKLACSYPQSLTIVHLE